MVLVGMLRMLRFLRLLKIRWIRVKLQLLLVIVTKFALRRML